MPQATHHNALARHWELLKALSDRPPGRTVKELTEYLDSTGFKVTKRTVERDLTELSRLFPLVCNDKGKPFGWHWAPGQSPNLPSLDIADALSLKLVEDLLRPLLPTAMLRALEPRFHQAHEKLSILARENRNARWLNKARQVSPTLPLIPPTLSEGVLEAVQQALLDEYQIQVEYQRSDDPEPRAFRLHPLALVQRGPVTYLIATAFDYVDVRLYALHRIQSVQPLPDEPVTYPKDFDLDTYIASGGLQFSMARTVRLVAIVSDDLAAILQETPLAADQSLTPLNNGEFQLKVQLMETWQLHWWLLSQGAGIEVQKPKHLRQMLKDAARDMTQMYAD